jgi:hypothetical protein
MKSLTVWDSTLESLPSTLQLTPFIESRRTGVGVGRCISCLHRPWSPASEDRILIPTEAVRQMVHLSKRQQATAAGYKQILEREKQNRPSQGVREPQAIPERRHEQEEDLYRYP